MPAPSTADEFLELASKSELLDPQDLQAFLQRRRSENALPETAQKLADALVREGLLTRFQVDQLLLGRWRNFILNGKYKVLGPLGSGGMGTVYLCEHLVMRRRVAVKVLPSRSSSPAALQRFRREARAVAQLHHINIVSGHDIDQAGKLHFLVMEYVDGNTFQRIVKACGPMAPLRAAHYIRQAALGLQHAHQAGLVHRDIKPSNLLLDRTGTVKVLDLGLARFFHDESDDLSKRHGETPLGTSDYMAPEQVLNSHAVDIRADIYSLGATCYFLLAGHSPFGEGTSLQKLIWQHVRQPRPIREVRPEVPEGLAAVVTKMMAKEPAERYQTPAEVAEALLPWAQTPIPPPPVEEMPGLLVPARTTSSAEITQALPAALFEPAVSFAVSGGPRFESDHPLEEDAVSTPVMNNDSTATPAPRSSLPPGVATPTPTLTPTTASRDVRAITGPGPLRSLPPETKTMAAAAAPRPGLTQRPRQRMLRVVSAVAVIVAVGVGGFAIYKLTHSEGGPSGGPGTAVSSPPALRLLVPAYFYPANDGLKQWDHLLDSPVAANIVAIANPSSGPGTVADPNYAKVLKRAEQKGVTVIGYVSTKYGDRPLDEVKADVDRWVHFYRTVQGIFFDEQSSQQEKLAYYTTLYSYVRKESGLGLVVTNPGTVCAEEYLAQPATDVVCMAEVVKEFSTYRRPFWADHYPAERFAALLCQTETAEQMSADVRAMRAKRIGYCYITDLKEPNPWERLPKYWDEEVAAVRQADAP